MRRSISFILPALIAAVLISGCGTSGVSSTHGGKVGAIQNSVSLKEKGAKNGVATLNNAQHVPQVQLASGGSLGECLQQGASESAWGSCGSGKSETEIKEFAATRNLSNVNTAAEARTHLGLGTAATKAEGEFVAGSSGKTTSSSFGSGTVEEAALASGAVVAAKIGSEAVTEAKLKGEAVTAAKIGSEAIEAGKIKSGAVTSTKLGSEAVEEAALHKESVALKKIKASAPAEGDALFVKAGGTELEWKLVSALSSESVITEYLHKEAVTAEKLAPGLLPAEEEPTPASKKVKINLKEHSVFYVKLKETPVEAEAENAANRPVGFQIRWKVESGGKEFKLKGVKWRGTKPVFGEAENNENILNCVIYKQENTEPYCEGEVGGVPAGGSEGQVLEKESATAFATRWANVSSLETHTWAIAGEVKKSETFPGFFAPTLLTKEKQYIKAIIFQITEGTSLGFEVKCGGSAVKWNVSSEKTELTATKTAEEQAVHTTTELTSKEYCSLATTAESATPKGLSATLVVEKIKE